MTFLWLPKNLREPLMNAQRFSPASVSAVSAWLRLAAGTVTGQGYSSIPDVLASNPAVQATDDRRPVNGTSANGLPIATFTDDLLSWPVSAGANGTTAWGMAFWMNETADGTVRRVFSARRTGASGGCSVDKLEVAYQNTRGMMLDAYASDGQAYRARSDTSATGLHFWTIEYDGSQSTDALKALITLDGVILTCTFETAAGAQASIPAALPAPTGSFFIGAQTTVPNAPLTGIIGPNIYFLNAQLTAAQRIALMNFEAPT